MKKGGIFLLVLIWTATLSLLVLTALGANAVSARELPQMTGSETGYVSVEPVQDSESAAPGGDRLVRVSGCLSESELASLLREASDGILGDVTVKTGTHEMTVYTSLAADAETVAEKYPQVGDDLLILRLMRNAPIEMSAKMTYGKGNGLSVSGASVAVYGVDLKEEDANALCEMLENELRYFLESGKTDWQRLELLPGGLYYTCTVNEDDSENIFKAKDEKKR